LFSTLQLTQANAGPTAILVDELDAGSFESLPHNSQRRTPRVG
jgi:hypothetical protein